MVSAEVRPVVLVVDDVALNRLVLSRMLSRLGFDALVAADGEECLKICHASRSTITCVLLDLHMPVLDGWCTAQQLRLWEATEGDAKLRMPLVACTTENLVRPSTAAERALLCGIDECITKPPSLDQLKAVLAKYVVPPKAATPAAAVLASVRSGTLASAACVASSFVQLRALSLSGLPDTSEQLGSSSDSEHDSYDQDAAQGGQQETDCVCSIGSMPLAAFQSALRSADSDGHISSVPVAHGPFPASVSGSAVVRDAASGSTRASYAPNCSMAGLASPAGDLANAAPWHWPHFAGRAAAGKSQSAHNLGYSSCNRGAMARCSGKPGAARLAGACSGSLGSFSTGPATALVLEHHSRELVRASSGSPRLGAAMTAGTACSCAASPAMSASRAPVLYCAGSLPVPRAAVTSGPPPPVLGFALRVEQLRQHLQWSAKPMSSAHGGCSPQPSPGCANSFHHYASTAAAAPAAESSSESCSATPTHGTSMRSVLSLPSLFPVPWETEQQLQQVQWVRPVPRSSGNHPNPQRHSSHGSASWQDHHQPVANEPDVIDAHAGAPQPPLLQQHGSADPFAHNAAAGVAGGYDMSDSYGCTTQALPAGRHVMSGRRRMRRRRLSDLGEMFWLDCMFGVPLSPGAPPA